MPRYFCTEEHQNKLDQSTSNGLRLGGVRILRDIARLTNFASKMLPMPRLLAQAPSCPYHHAARTQRNQTSANQARTFAHPSTLRLLLGNHCEKVD
eukprot:4658312-Amphidinium_carterae.1